VTAPLRGCIGPDASEQWKFSDATQRLIRVSSTQP
jgi:hypothetical protein